MMDKQQKILELISDLINDCTDPQWDLGDSDNWENMVSHLEQVMEYVKGGN